MNLFLKFLIFFNFSLIVGFPELNFNVTKEDLKIEKILENLNNLNATNFENLNLQDPDIVQKVADSMNVGQIDQQWLLEMMEGPKNFFQEKCGNVSGKEEAFENAYVSNNAKTIEKLRMDSQLIYFSINQRNPWKLSINVLQI